jgi:hypothetical protein
VVFIKAASSGSASPVNGTTYNANTVYASGTQIGSTGWYCVYSGTGTSVTVTGLSTATTYRVMVCEFNGSSGGQMYNTNTATNNPNNVTTLSPTISVAGSYGAFTACYGNVSSEQAVIASGQYLIANITVNAPAGFEISTTSGSGFGDSLTLTPTGGTVASTYIFTRLKSTNAVGSYSGNVSFASTGATTQNASVSGTVNTNLSSVSISPATSQTICGNSIYTTSGNTLTVTETGSSVTSRYWGTRSVSGGTITAIPGENMTTFTPTLLNLNEGNWYIVCVSTPVCGSVTVSNEVYVSIHLNPTVDYISGQTWTYIDGTSTLSCSTTGGVWSSSNPSIATINQSGVVTAVSEGNTQITYTVTSNGCTGNSSTWFSVIKYDQTISFTLASPVEVGVSPITLTGTATSGLPVSYVSSDPSVASVSGNTLTILSAGYISITASQAGNSTYYPAANVVQYLMVTQKTPQTITFTLSSPQTINTLQIFLNGYASSNLPVSYTSSNPSVATVTGNTLTLVGLGYTTITASQPGNWMYAPAPDVTQELAVYDAYNTWIGGTSGSETDWNNASNWSYITVPVYWDDVTIPAFPSFMPHVTSPPESPAECGNIKIYEGASLTIDPGKALTVNGALNNLAGVSGLIVDSDSSGTGSLINFTYNVPGTIKRYISGSSNLDSMMYHLVSIPLTTETYSESSLFLGSYLYDFNTETNSWNGLGTSTTTELDENRGYMIYLPEESHTYSFEGNFNSMSGYSYPWVSGQNEGFNLLPNPYPSGLDWDSWGVIKEGIANALYMWPAGGYNYISYIDGVAIPEQTQNPSVIPVGQSFFIKATYYPGVYIFDAQAARVHSARAFQKSGCNTTDLLRIKASANNKSDEAVIRFKSNATVKADNDLDAWKMFGLAGAPQIYTQSDDGEKLSINSLPYSENTCLVPLAFSMDRDIAATFQFSNLQSFDNSVRMILKDKKTGQMINIRQTPTYTFDYYRGDPADRFELIFNGATGIQDASKDEIKMWFSREYLNISSPSNLHKDVILSLFNTSGQELYRQQVSLDGQNRFAFQFRGPVIARLIDDQATYHVKGILTD